MMDTQFARLITLLHEETDAYRGLLACLQNEKRAIIDIDLAKLAEVGKQKENLLSNLRSLGEQRRLALEALSQTLALPLQQLTLRGLVKKAPPPCGEQLQRCAAELQGVIEELQIENSSVKQLVTKGLELVRGSYNLFAHLFDAGAVYRSSGSLQPAPAAGRLYHGDY